MIDETLFLFANSNIRKVFEKILEARRIQLRDLTETVGDKDEVNDAVRILTDKHLIETTDSPVSDFATVYPTSEGLSIARRLKVPG